MVLALGLGLTTSITVFAAAPWLADFLAAQLTPEAHAMFIRYVRIDCWGYVLYSIVLVCGGIVRAAGDTRTPMRIMIGVNFANALISSSLVFGWFGQSFGASGIAFGTVMARTIGGLLMIYVLTKGLDGLKLNWREMKPDFEILQRILRVGLPAAADAGVMWLAQMAFIKIIASTGHGAAATANYAAHMIAMRFEALTYLPAMAWMTAAATLVGQYLGADDQRRATRAGHIAALQGACLTMIVSVSFWTMAGMLYSLFTQDSGERRHAHHHGNFSHRRARREAPAGVPGRHCAARRPDRRLVRHVGRQYHQVRAWSGPFCSRWLAPRKGLIDL